jgi:hypothetical protein
MRHLGRCRPDMHCSTPTNTEPADIARLFAPIIPIVDWRPIRGSLGAFRAGYEEIEQFVGQLLDEIDAAWQQLDAERSRFEDSHGIAAIEAQAGTALLRPLSSPDSFHNGALERRIAELEEDRYALQAEVDFTRNQLAEQAKQLSDERRQAADERATWASELRLLREAIYQQMAAFDAMPPTPTVIAGTPADRPPSGSAESHGPNDPVLGPLLAQFKILQRDAARRREMAEKQPE